MSENRTSVAPTNARQRRSLGRRLGCWFLVVMWFLLLLTPCFFGILATQEEIHFQTGELSSQVVRIWLLNDAKTRGIGFSRPTVQTLTDGTRCVQTDVSFLLWAGESKPTTYCECYQADGALIESFDGTCALR